MIRKIIGTILILVGGFLLVVLLTNGLLFPHILGPTTLAVIGAILLALPGKTR
jgi:hypothetical protein